MRLPFQWKQGEHLAVIGTTGTGKTTLASQIVSQRKYLLSIITKDKNDAKDLPGKIYRNGETLKDIRVNQAVIYPPYEREKAVIADVLENVWKQGGWTCYIDELFSLTEQRLDYHIKRLLQRGRSKGISFVSGMQRPTTQPGATTMRFAISQSSHVIAFRADGRDAKVVGQATAKVVEDAINNLGEHDFVWWYGPKRQMWIGHYDIKTGELVKNE